MRTVLAGVIVTLLLAPGARAGDSPVAGNWKVTILQNGQAIPLWLVRFEDKAGKLTGEATALRGVPPSKFDQASIQGDVLLFGVRLGKDLLITFEAKLPAPGSKKILGSANLNDKIIPAYLEATTAKSRFELDRDTVIRTPNDPRVFVAAIDLLKAAKAEKAAGKDVQEWAEIVLKSSEGYGPRFQADFSSRLLDSLADYPETAITIGKKMEAGLDAKAPLTARIRLLDLIAGALKKSGQVDQAKELGVKIEGLELPAYQDYVKTSIEFPITKYAGRKGKSNRAVLVELFTGAQCPPCVAADIAFDAVERTYKNTEVVLLQYHMHVPGPDALANADTDLRCSYYGEVIDGMPSILFNGKVGAPGGGDREDAKDKFLECRSVIEPLLEKEASLQLTAQAVKKANKIDISAAVTGLQKPGEKIRLRLALVEDWVRYKGNNGMTYHHRVVRALPGGTKGLTLAKADGELKVTVDLDDVQRQLSKYLDDFANTKAPFPDGQRPLRLKPLHVVAFVQDDATMEVLQAVDVAVREE